MWYIMLLCEIYKEISMANTEGRAQLAKGIDQLTEENLLYVLAVSQALAFAQGTINAPRAEPLDADRLHTPEAGYWNTKTGHYGTASLNANPAKLIR
jgi:hypothetical protein